MTLLEEIQSGPKAAQLAPLIAAQDFAGAAALLSENRVRRGAVSRNNFAVWCGETGMRAVIEAHAANPDSPLRSIALLCRDLLQGGPDVLDFSLPGNVAMLTAWVQANVGLDQSQADALVTLGDVQEVVTRGQVAHALGQTGWSAKLVSTAVNDGLVHCMVEFTKTSDSTATFNKVFSAQDMTPAHLKALTDDMIVQLYTRDTAQDSLIGLTSL